MQVFFEKITVCLKMNAFFEKKINLFDKLKKREYKLYRNIKTNKLKSPIL